MGKIDLPQQDVAVEKTIQDKVGNEIADSLPAIDDEMKEKIEKEAGIEEDGRLTDEAIKLISYKRYLGIKADDKDELSYLGKIDKLLEEQGLKRQKERAEVIKEVQYKLGGKPSMSKVYQYLKIEAQIKSLVKKLSTL